MSEPTVLRRLRGTARACLLAMLVVVAASAFLRHHGASAALHLPGEDQTVPFSAG